MIYIAILLAFLAGASIVVARIINANLARKIGLFQGTIINYITGLSLASIFFLILGDKTHFGDDIFRGIPFWAYLGGLVGIMVVMLSSYLTHKVSSFYMTLFVFIGQLVFGMIIDYFGHIDVSLGKIVGGTLVLTGLIYNLMLDRKDPDIDGITKSTTIIKEL